MINYKWIKHIVNEVIFLFRLLNNQLKNIWWDRLHNVSTSGLKKIDKQDVKSKHNNGSCFFESSGAAIFKDIIVHLNIDYSAYHFIDIGAGKGRVLLMALELPFKKITGIEFAGKLIEIANKNITCFSNLNQRCFSVECIEMDAFEYDFPDDNSVIYLFNPFNSILFDKFLDKLITSLQENGKECFIVYLAPMSIHSDIIENKSLFKTYYKKKGFDGFDTYSIYKFSTNQNSAIRTAKKMVSRIVS